MLNQPTLTAWGPAERSTRFYGKYVGQKDQTYDKPQELLPKVPHISLTPFLKGVANRLLCNSARPHWGRSHSTIRAAVCQFAPFPAWGTALAFAPICIRLLSCVSLYRTWYPIDSPPPLPAGHPHLR